MSAITKKPFIDFNAIPQTEVSTKKPKVQYVNRRYLPVPGIVNDYNHFMGSVDIADQYRAKFNVQQHSQRNWLPLFYWLLDTTIVNAFFLSEKQRKASTTDPKQVRSAHLAFREALVDGLLAPYTAGIQKVYITRKTHLPACQLDPPVQIHQKAHFQSTRECLLCRWMQYQHKENMQQQFLVNGGSNYTTRLRIAHTKIYCNHCQVSLCSKCFDAFHSTNTM